MPIPDPDIVFDELLVMQYKAGDKRAMGLLMKRWNRRIVLYIFRNTKSMEAAKDIGQEVWVVALKKIHHLSDTLKVGSWLLAIAHYKSMDWLRDAKKRETRMENLSVEQKDDSQGSSDQLQSMREAMLKLSKEHRNILSLFYLEGFAITDISHILQLSTGTVKSRLFYARESLKKKIKSINHE